jgi:hypothetical protein
MSGAPPSIPRGARFEAAALWQRVLSRYLHPAGPERLAVVRVFVGAFAIGYLIYRYRVLSGAASLDPAAFAPVGIVRLIDAPLPLATTRVIYACTLALAIPFTLGIAFRWLAPVFALLVLWLCTYRSSWGMIFHSDNLLVWHIAILACVQADGALALTRPRAPKAHVAYGWPLRFIMIVTALAYFVAGVAKVRGTGLHWLSGDALRHHVAFNAIRKLELGSTTSSLTTWLVRHDAVFVPMAWGTLLLELGGPLALVHRRTAHAWALGMYAFHWCIEATMSIAFWYPLSFVPFAAFFPVERLLAIKTRLRRSTAQRR